MKILKNNIDSLISDIKKHNFKGILLYGSDVGVVAFREEQIKKQFHDFENIKFDLSGGSDLQDVINEIYTPSFFGNKKFLHISGVDTRQQNFASLIDATTNFEGFILIVFSQNLDAKSGIRKVCEDDAKIATIACFADEDEDIYALIKKFLSSKKLEIEQDAGKWIVEKFKRDRGVLMMELEKLSLFKQEGKITQMEAMHLMDEENAGNVFDAINYFFSLNKVKFILELDALKEELPPSVFVINLINYNFKLMEIIEEKERTKKTFDTILSEKFIFFKQIPIMKNQLSKWNLKMLNNLVEALIEIEIEVRKNIDNGYNYILIKLLPFFI